MGRVMQNGGHKLLHEVKEDWITGHGAQNATLGLVGEASYRVSATGYYCVRFANPHLVNVAYKADFNNPYGNLPPELYPLLKTSALLCVAYGTGLLVWIALSMQHRKHLVNLQTFIGVVIGLSFVEMFITFYFYQRYNSTSLPCKQPHEHGCLTIHKHSHGLAPVDGRLHCHQGYSISVFPVDRRLGIWCSQVHGPVLVV